MSLGVNSFSSFSMSGSSGVSVTTTDSKENMRGLNSRLADYLDKVRELQEANNKLEAQIRERVSSRSSEERDWSQYEKTIENLREQLKELIIDNGHLMLQIDNTRLAADDFKVKFEAEHAVRQGVDQDVANLKKIIDDTHMSQMQLESEIESLKEELIFLKKNHEEDIANMKGQMRGSSVDVQMEARKSENLSEIIDRIRQQYEKAAQKSREETEAWYQNKFDGVSAEVSKSTETLQEGKSEINDLRRQKQMLEIELQTLHNTNHSLEDNLKDTSGRYARQMNHHNGIIQQLEAELGEVHAQVMRQGAEYEALLNIKTKLEEEIATYHRLLEGTGVGDGISDVDNREGGNVRGSGKHEDTNTRGTTDINIRGSGTREDTNTKGTTDIKINGSGTRDDADVKGTGPHQDANVKGTDPQEDANFKDSGAPEDSNMAEDDIVEFSLEQALNAARPVMTPDQVPKISEEIVEVEVVSREQVNLNTANGTVENEGNTGGGEREEDTAVVEEPPRRSPAENMEEKIEEVVQETQNNAELKVEEKHNNGLQEVQEKLEDGVQEAEEKEDGEQEVEEKLENAGQEVEEKHKDAGEEVLETHEDAGQEVEKKQDVVVQKEVKLEELKVEPLKNKDEQEE